MHNMSFKLVNQHFKMTILIKNREISLTNTVKLVNQRRNQFEKKHNLTMPRQWSFDKKKTVVFKYDKQNKL